MTTINDSEMTPLRIELDIRYELTRLAAIKEALSSVAINSVYQKTILVQAAKHLSKESELLLSQARALEIEVPELFGGEESYWVLFRILVTREHVNTVVGIDEIWNILGKTFDMSAETPKSLLETITSFKDDIQTDAAERGFSGELKITATAIVFECEASDTPVVEPVSAPSITAIHTRTPQQQPEPILIEEVESETVVEEISAEVSIRTLLHIQPEGVMKQSELKKALLKQGVPYSFDQLQTVINEMVDTKALYKFKRNTVGYVSLAERSDELSNVPTSAEIKQPEEATIDPIHVAIAEKILHTLTAPKTHVQQSVSMSELWRRIRGEETKSQPIPNDELEVLKIVCRQLGSMGILEAGSAPKGTGGTRTNSANSMKRRRSASQEVFKVKLSNQMTKNEIQDAIELNMLREYIQSSRAPS